ncbi:MAG: class I SAM-dependent methyltransferase, partial [Candidatus Thermoplasmatota archaeon]|nr:class I SAM-dependent methyltransferase [Candidatus Thermoplasmatota archaeon]
TKIGDRFDLVVCSHFLWQVEDIEGHLKKMENASKRYCAVIQPCGRDEVVKKAFEEICKERYTGQFEADAEYFPYVILREWSRCLDVRRLEYSFELNLEEGIRYIASYLGKFIDVDEQVADKIKKFLIAEVGKHWVVRDNAIVMWWEPGK